MTEQEYWNDPRRLFRLWKEYSGEDLLNGPAKEQPVKKAKK